MTGQELRYIREGLGLTQAELAKRLQVAMLTVLRWENNQARVPYAVDMAMKQIEEEG